MAAATRPPQQRQRFQIPTGGLNARVPIYADNVEDSLFNDNAIARAMGLELRKGWREHLDHDFNFDNPVPTLLSYMGANSADNALFAAVAEGDGEIYEVTTPGSTPGPSEISTTGSTTPGVLAQVLFVNSSGAHLCTVSPGWGYGIYDAAGGWRLVLDGVGAGKLTFPDAGDSADFTHIFAWKNRLWFLNQNSSKAYYLPVNQITGVLAAFDFGPMLKHGGPLSYGANWTYDGGSGLDDFLVLVGTNGDVIVYQGTDPSDPETFGLKGVWFAGRVPKGMRGVCSHGGDLLILTELGIVSVADLVAGKLTKENSLGSFGPKYNVAIAPLVSDTLDEGYWYLLPYFTEELLYIGSPYINPISNYLTHFALNSLTEAWNTFTNLPAYCATVHEGQFYFGTLDGRVCQGFVGYRDNDSWNGDIVGDEVIARGQTFYHGLGDDTSNARCTRVRLLGIADGFPAVYIRVASEYAMANNLNVSSNPATAGSLWDSALWDVALWESSRITLAQWFGVASFGKKLSVQWAVRGAGYTLLTDYEMDFTKGIGL